MGVGHGRAVAVVALAAAVSLALSGCECSKVRQEVLIASPDAELQTLIVACSTHMPAPGERCDSLFGDASVFGDASMPVDCACLPLCRRVLQIIDQFPGAEKIFDCQVIFPQEGGARVTVTYRPSTCG